MIDYAVLKRRLKNPAHMFASGRPTHLSLLQEKSLIEWILNMNFMRRPVTPNILKAQVRRLSKDPNFLACSKWYQGFLKRHKDKIKDNYIELQQQ